MDAEPYRPSVLAKLFHRLPHLNITMHYVNNTFLPRNPVYLEALGILASLPALWLILTLFLLLIYLCTRCCDRKPRPKHSISMLKWTLSIFTILCCGALAVGLYGNNEVHEAVGDFSKALGNVDSKITELKQQTKNIEDNLQLKIYPFLNNVGEHFEDPVANMTARALLLASLGSVMGNTTIALNSCQNISRPLQGINLTVVLQMIDLPEGIRWPGTIAWLVVFLLFCLIVFYGVARHSRCCLILFSVFGLFAVILNWLLTSVYLATSVAAGDLCVAPEGFLIRESPSTLQAEILKYYVTCEPSRKNPFTQRFRDMQRATDAMATNLNIVIKIAHELYPKRITDTRMDILTKDISEVHKRVSPMAAILDCRQLHQEYEKILKSVCDSGLNGLAFMLLSSFAAGLLFTVLVWVDSHTWIYIRKRRDYLQVAEQDPFLPASAASQAIAARTLRNQGLYNQPQKPKNPTTRLPSPPRPIPSAPFSPPTPSPRYTPLPRSKQVGSGEAGQVGTFREQLMRDTQSVYYDASIAPLYESVGDSEEGGFGYYSWGGQNSGKRGSEAKRKLENK